MLLFATPLTMVNLNKDFLAIKGFMTNFGGASSGFNPPGVNQGAMSPHAKMMHEIVPMIDRRALSYTGAKLGETSGIFI